MTVACVHLPANLGPPVPSGNGCQECLAAGKHNWVHLRLCQVCGHVGCCDQSPGHHATAHFHQSEHPLVRSFEPGEDWWWCYRDEEIFLVPGAPPAPSYS
jgi:hypothetical protein